MTVLQDEPIVPADTEAESRLIGGALLDSGNAILLADHHAPSDFHFRPHQWIFNAIGGAVSAQEPVTAATISRRLASTRAPGSRTNCLVEMGGEDILFGMLNGVDPTEFGFWGERVRTVRKQRELYRLAERAKKAALGATDIDVALAEFENELNHVSQTTHGATHIGGGIDALRERVVGYANNSNAITGLSTGWTRYDGAMDGHQRGTLTLIFGPTSNFKSLFLANILLRFARAGAAGCLFSTEMPRIAVNERLLQIESGYNLRWLKRRNEIGDHMAELDEAMDAIAGYPIFHSDSFDLDVSKVTAEIARQKRWNNIEWAMVDLLDGVSTTHGEGVAAEEYITNQLKGCALKNDIALIVTAHMNKDGGENRPMAVPPISRIKGSASKSQDMDSIVSVRGVGWDNENGQWKALDDMAIQARIDYSGKVSVLVAVQKARMGEKATIEFEADWNVGGRMEEVK